ncbi:hypothetical protein K458DRAFT_392812 [Lentithecium fluviatile CBS 122367]|uniref:BZIP domain-containing protein n=1 Tax=Lentithecium fluviatile CBS 122367 TaxID=1168545 RepID=A0A6G1IQE9_9PLEO|nr:hypothetical protein K458DRAFT_392812 [Lentithecium fluviatile CBS 122367]
MDRAKAVPVAVSQYDYDKAQFRRRFGYGDWLGPMVSEIDLPASSTEARSPEAVAAESTPARRGRGRPRVNKPRDQSAVEKRRAQVREAQRTYQKRKDGATATERKRCDAVLEVMSDLSTDIEALLQAASKAGLMNQQGNFPDHVRRLWSSYDAAINSPCVKPELRLLQVKNDRRRAEHHSNDGFRIEPAPNPRSEPITQESPRIADPKDINASQLDMELMRVGDTTVLQPLHQIRSSSMTMAGRSIFDVVKERQADFERSQEQGSAPT